MLFQQLNAKDIEVQEETIMLDTKQSFSWITESQFFSYFVSRMFLSVN